MNDSTERDQRAHDAEDARDAGHGQDAPGAQQTAATPADEEGACDHAEQTRAADAPAERDVTDADGGQGQAAGQAGGQDTAGLWPVERLQPVLEAVLFAAADAMQIRRICEIIDGATRPEVARALAQIQEDCRQRGFRLVEVAGGWQFRTAPEHHDTVRRLFKEKPHRLTRAQMEVLTIIAYKQPGTRAEVETVRGVDSSSVMEALVERRLVRIAGRRDVPGRPLVYQTTQEFLELFGLKDLRSLPALPELGQDVQTMAERSGFDDDAAERDAAVIPLDEDDTGEEVQGQPQQREEAGGEERQAAGDRPARGAAAQEDGPGRAGERQHDADERRD